jgi:hypothetical protein
MERAARASAFAPQSAIFSRRSYTGSRESDLRLTEGIGFAKGQ